MYSYCFIYINYSALIQGCFFILVSSNKKASFFSDCNHYQHNLFRFCIFQPSLALQHLQKWPALLMTV